MEPISRRSALTLGGLGAAFVIAGGAGLIWDGSTGIGTSTGAGGPALAQPEQFRSVNGRLEVSLSAGPTRVSIGGALVNVLAYNGALPGPTLIVRPGDELAVSLHNGLSAPTNLHAHGLHVSPEGSGDNVFRRIESGETARYSYAIPANHPAGVFWYHPHHHGTVADQVFSGLYGAVVVADAETIPVARERMLIVSDITFDSAGDVAAASQMDRMSGREGTTVMVNGQLNPTLTTTAGERERWRIVNACTSRYLDLRLDGQTLLLLGKDSGRFRTPKKVDSVRLAPGNRSDVLITMRGDTSILQALPVDRGSSNVMMGGGSRPSVLVDLATVRVARGTATTFASLAPQTASRDLRASAIARSRTLTFAMGMDMGMGGMMSFTIDGKSFDANRIDAQVHAGSVEEWTIVNTSPMDHPFHLHVWPMQVVEPGGSNGGEPVWQDVVNVPARGQVRVRIAFEDFTGKSMYHCHILDHEDNGMMGVIDVR